MEVYDIYDLLFTIYDFSFHNTEDCRGRRPRNDEDRKFAFSCAIGICVDPSTSLGTTSAVNEVEKTKPIQSQTKPINWRSRFHVQSSALRSGKKGMLKKQSQFLRGLNERNTNYDKGL
jgi:hypothetical protein